MIKNNDDFHHSPTHTHTHTEHQALLLLLPLLLVGELLPFLSSFYVGGMGWVGCGKYQRERWLCSEFQSQFFQHVLQKFYRH